jgi:hypothetical protein
MHTIITIIITNISIRNEGISVSANHLRIKVSIFINVIVIVIVIVILIIMNRVMRFNFQKSYHYQI